MKIHHTSDGPSNASSLSIKVPGGTKKTTPPPASQLQRRTRYQYQTPAGESRSSTTASGQRRRGASNIEGRSSSQRTAKGKNSSSQRSFSSTSRVRGLDADPVAKQLVDEGFPVFQWLLILSFIGFAWYQLARPKRQQQQGKNNSKKKFFNSATFNTTIPASPRKGRKGSKMPLHQTKDDSFKDSTPPLAVDDKTAIVKEDETVVTKQVKGSPSSVELKKKTRKKRTGKRKENIPLTFDTDSPDSVSTDGSASSVEQAKEWADSVSNIRSSENVPKEGPRDDEGDGEVLDSGTWTTVEIKSKSRPQSVPGSSAPRNATVVEEVQICSVERSIAKNDDTTVTMPPHEEATCKKEYTVDSDESLAKMLQEEEERAAVSLGDEQLNKHGNVGMEWEEVPTKKKKNKRKDAQTLF